MVEETLPTGWPLQEVVDATLASRFDVLAILDSVVDV